MVDMDQQNIAQLMNIGEMTEEQAVRALKKWHTLEAALDGWFSGGLDDPDMDDAPPALIPVDDSDQPPAYNPFGPQAYYESAAGQSQTRINTTPTPSSTSKELALYQPPAGPPPASQAILDLTGDDLQSNKQDDELERALKLSTEGQDAEMDKALALSISDLKNNDASTSSTSGVHAIPPEQRIRLESSPAVLRSPSPLHPLLASYLQCLFSLPTWRKAILEYQPTQADVDCRATFAGLWSGDTNEQLQGLLARDNAKWGMIAIQRLFSLMIHTRRSFLHIAEIVQNFPSAAKDLATPGSDPTSVLKSFHTDLVEQMRRSTEEWSYRQLIDTDPSWAEPGATDKEATRREGRFSFRGREVINSEAIGILPPADPEESLQSECIINLLIDPTSSESQTIYTSLDSTFVGSASSDSLEEQEDASFALLTNVPETLVFTLHRQVPAVTSLDSFGGGDASKRKVFDIQEEVWLDRYHVNNRVKIREGRRRMRELRKEVAELRGKRQRLAITVDGKDGIDLVRQTLKYLEEVSSSSDDEDVDTERRARQAQLAEQYRAVLHSMESQVAAYDDRLTHLERELDGVFDTDSMRRIGPFRLTGIVMRNGLNGRGSAWSVVSDQEGRWWRVEDLTKVEIKLEDALKDTSGLHMNAGATMLFYQRSTADLELAPTPPLLEYLANLDNHSFAADLPPELRDSLQLPDLPSRPPSPDPLARMDTDADAVQVAAEEILSFPHDRDYSPPAVAVELEETTATPMEGITPPPIVLESSLVEEKMSVDGDVQHIETVASAFEEEAMRLRGGGGGEDEEDYSDDEEYDEDEVELGVLKPMPTDTEWDVDFAVGKVGGLPKYLDPRSPLDPKDVECGICRGTMSLLLQVNSPDDTRPHAAARALYVFGCRGKECATKDINKAMKVWRSQMSSPNDFFPHTEATQQRRKELEDTIKPDSALSGPASAVSVTAWPEWDVAAEPEPYEESYLPEPIEKSNEDGVNGEDAAEPDTWTGVDAAFLAFQDRIERVPEQVLRFYRLPGVEDPQPLRANNRKIAADAIPLCSVCSRPRQVEFQIVSTLLNFLKDDHFQFDSLLVYTCADNCEIPSRPEGKTGWAEECVVEDKFTSAGVVFGQGS